MCIVWAANAPVLARDCTRGMRAGLCQAQLGRGQPRVRAAAASPPRRRAPYRPHACSNNVRRPLGRPGQRAAGAAGPGAERELPGPLLGRAGRPLPRALHVHRQVRATPPAAPFPNLPHAVRMHGDAGARRRCSSCSMMRILYDVDLAPALQPRPGPEPVVGRAARASSCAAPAPARALRPPARRRALRRGEGERAACWTPSRGRCWTAWRCCASRAISRRRRCRSRGSTWSRRRTATPACPQVRLAGLQLRTPWQTLPHPRGVHTRAPWQTLLVVASTRALADPALQAGPSGGRRSAATPG